MYHDMLVDIGFNLTSSQFDPDRDAVLARARDAGVEHMVLTGTSLEGSRRALQYAQEDPKRLSATVGIHPHDARHFALSDLPEMRTLASHAIAVAIGECGLDHNRNFSTPKQQANCFEAHLKLAQESGLPLFMHERDAHDAFVEILEPYLDGQIQGIVHCFTGSRAMLSRYLDLGLYIGITGWLCDERRGHDLRDAVRFLPLDRMMLETDAPYLIPRNIRPKPRSRRNEPMHLPHIAQSVADIVECDVQTVISETGRNAVQFFGLEDRC